MPRPEESAIKGPAVLALATCLAVPCLGSVNGRVTLEMEYLGEYYVNEVGLDLPSPEITDEVLLEQIRFSEDTWLPGNRIELDFRSSLNRRREVEVVSFTGVNSQRLYQEVLGSYVSRHDNHVWRLEAEGSIREASDSFVGHGDWSSGLTLEREDVGATWKSVLEARYQRSRTRGDSTSFLFDYDRVEVRGRLRKDLRERSHVEGFINLRKKTPAFGLGGAYEEGRVGLGWGDGGRSRWGIDLTQRAYQGDHQGVGRNFREVLLFGQTRMARLGRSHLWLELEGAVTDFEGEDDLFYDYAEVEVFAGLDAGRSDGSLLAGPFLRMLWDTSGRERDFIEWRGRVQGNRTFSFLGFVHLGMDLGYRNYARNADAEVEVTSLSASFLRTDYWLVDILAMASIPLSSEITLDVLGDTMWEFHPKQDEQIKVSFVTVGITKNF